LSKVDSFSPINLFDTAKSPENPLRGSKSPRKTGGKGFPGIITNCAQYQSSEASSNESGDLHASKFLQPFESGVRVLCRVGLKTLGQARGGFLRIGVFKRVFLIN